MEQAETDIVQGSSSVAVTREGRVALHKMRVAAYEVTDHQLMLIDMTSRDVGFDFNVFVASGSIATTILLTLQTTEIKDANTKSWWDGGFIAFSFITLIFLIKTVRAKNALKETLVEIREQKLHDT